MIPQNSVEQVRLQHLERLGRSVVQAYKLVRDAVCSATLARECASRKILSGFFFYTGQPQLPTTAVPYNQRYSGLSADNRGGSLQ